MAERELLMGIRELLARIDNEHKAADESDGALRYMAASEHRSRADDYQSQLAADFAQLDTLLSAHNGPINWRKLTSSPPASDAAEVLYPATPFMESIPDDVRLVDLDECTSDDQLDWKDYSADNYLRAQWALRGLRSFALMTLVSDESPELVLGDFLANARHLCDALGLDYDKVDANGAMHYDAELRGE
jgi:hypothetical protein